MALRTRPPVANAGKARAGEAGSALLAVLGAVAALSAIAFAMMAAAHNALDRASLQADSAKAYFLARGGIEAALHEMSAGIVPGHMAAGMDSREYVFETGVAKVSIASENGKLNVNRTGREAMASLLASAGATQVESDSLAERILSYRRDLLAGRLDHFGLPLARGSARFAHSSFERRIASIQVIEELLSVPGITPDLLYGTYRAETAANGGSGALRRVDGLRRFLRTAGPAAVDINAAPKAVLVAAGLGEPLASQLVEARQTVPLSPRDPLFGRATRESAGAPMLANSMASAWTVTSTAVLQGRRATRSVSAVVSTDTASGRLRIKRWYEHPL